MVRVIAHRGASAYAPENTLAAFRLAAEMGADGIELDCRLTRDEAVVVIHDDTLERTTDGRGRVGDMTLAEVKVLDAGSWKSPEFSPERIPTLEEALALAKRLNLTALVELKSECGDTWALEAPQDAPSSQDQEQLAGALSLIHTTIEEIRRQSMTGRVTIQSFSPAICAGVRAFAPECSVALLADTNNPGAVGNALAWSKLYDLGINAGKDSLTERQVREMKAQGRRVGVWTLDEPEEIRGFAACGVDAIITNRPDVCREIVGSDKQ